MLSATTLEVREGGKIVRYVEVVARDEEELYRGCGLERMIGEHSRIPPGYQAE